MNLEPEEPDFGPWHIRTVDAILGDALAQSSPVPGAPLVIAIDGRSAAGKTTLADALASVRPRTVVVHTDDLAWHEPLFEWAHLLRNGILAPLRERTPVFFTPPQWVARGRAGAIEVQAGTEVVIIEGVGAANVSVSALLDTTVWIQSDRLEARNRGLERDVASGENGDHEATLAFWDEWGAAERAYLAADRPWDRASIMVTGTPPFPVPPGFVAMADAPLRPRRVPEPQLPRSTGP